MLISRQNWVSIVMLTLAITLYSFVPASSDDAIRGNHVKLPAPKPTCAAPRKMPSPAPAAPPYDSDAPAEPTAQRGSKNSIVLISLPEPNSVDGKPVILAHDKKLTPLTEGASLVALPELLDMPLPAPPADESSQLPEIRPAFVQDEPARKTNVSQVTFEVPEFLTVKCLRGKCPVGIQKRELHQADPAVSLDHDGYHYVFQNEAARTEFKASPEKFIPALGGDCVVAFARTGDRVTGNFVAVYEGKQYWFADEQARRDFKTDPQACLARVEWLHEFLSRRQK